MRIKVMMLGDVVGTAGVDYLVSGGRLRREALSRGVSFVVVNGENASEGNGLTQSAARTLLDAGADVITGGNHILRKKNLYSMLEDGERIIRPANYSPRAPGHGYTTVNVNGWRFLVVNLAGQVFMDSRSSPFDAFDRIMEAESGNFDAVLVDIHAEATSEKGAIARYADGRAAVVAGTHTHVQTADACVLPGGTGYITDLGMCGSRAGVLGVKTGCILHRFLVGTPVTFEPAEGEVFATGALFELEVGAGGARCVAAETLKF